jgi:hypothetical protein
MLLRMMTCTCDDQLLPPKEQQHDVEQQQQQQQASMIVEQCMLISLQILCNSSVASRALQQCASCPRLCCSVLRLSRV